MDEILNHSMTPFDELRAKQREEFASRYGITLDAHECGWRRWGDEHTYVSPLLLGRFDPPKYEFMTDLGRIKLRKDGRFDYWLTPRRWRADWPPKKVVQGVARSIEAAKLKVEEGWGL